MIKTLLLILLFCLQLFSLDEIEQKVLNDLGINSSFLNTQAFKSVYDEYSSSSQINYYNNILRKSALNMEIVREEIEKRNLPDAMFFIPLFESSYVNQGKGKGPGGLWQIIPQTASNLKLKIDDNIDERLDLLKSTDAAGTYLKRYYKIFNKWYLAIAAYNSGEGRIISGIARASLDKYLEENPNEENNPTVKIYKKYIDDYNKNKSGMSNLYIIYDRYKSYFDLVYLVNNNHKDYFSKTTVTYISKIVTFSILKEKDSFSAIDKKAKYNLEVVNPPKGVQLKSIAGMIGMDFNEFRNLNKHIKKDVLPTSIKSYNIYIPHTKLDVYNQKLGNIKQVIAKNNNKQEIDTKKVIKNDSKKDVSKKQGITVYEVKAGDTLESIAKKYKTSTKKLKIISKKSKKVLSIGDKIEIVK
ncbi:lytic transglycosylase domain-containing protein [Aliarcobacter cibarius]|uniref:LysM peptidoglycan-binding domain-containing protein n=1 Tax=Aliarcobacter cibarius TaxID=255507 RepID=A0ABY2V7Y0_9BACT|nr:lytic transglycosylase domain-containing protein [Aliarcobacter cibarius]TLS98832.1 LysM peptidoglycan-binding domain-containing protein [Aliarcobacter cibarius]TLS99627.1 LysM peptidoglycan-binding domain-containing protein [Aliarcobacter cibarius]